VSVSAERKPGDPLTGSPHTFYIFADPSHADSIDIVSKSAFQDTVGKWMSVPLQVMAFDSLGNAVKDGQPIDFKVTKGNGHLGSNTSIDSTTVTDTTVTTDERGIAAIYWQLGPKAGPADSQVVEATASGGIGNLKGSPLYFKASAVSDITDPDSSKIVAKPNYGLKADGKDSSTVTVTLRDRFNNPVKDVSVQLFTQPEDLGVHITLPENTDPQGETRGIVKSTKAGSVFIHAKDVDNKIEVNQSAKIVFDPGNATIPGIFAGDYQKGNVGTILPDSLQVKVFDKNGNGVPTQNVIFTVSGGNGSFYDGVTEKDTVKTIAATTDSLGIAGTLFVLGTEGESNFVQATVPGIGKKVTFTETGITNPTPESLIVVSGNHLSAAPGAALPEPVGVKLKDRQGRPIWGKKVLFQVRTFGSIDSSAISDMFGIAAAQATVGPKEGLNKYRASIAENPNIFVDIVDTTIVPEGIADEIISADGTEKVQKGIVGHRLAAPFWARAIDKHGNVVKNVDITFFVDNNTNSFLQDSLKTVVKSTGEDGRTFITLKLDTLAGANVIKAFAAGTDTVDLFIGYGLADEPFSMEKPAKDSGDKQKYEMGKFLPKPIWVLVKDKYGNPAPNGTVWFIVENGGGLLQADAGSSLAQHVSAKSDSDGHAAVRWQLGANVVNQASASPGFADHPTVYFTATGDANHYPEFDKPEQLVNHEAIILYKNQDLTFFVYATDADSDSITYSALRLPPGSTFDLSSNLFVWTPTHEQAGDPDSVYYAVFKATDSPNSGVVVDSLKIIVRNTIQPAYITGAEPEGLGLFSHLGTSGKVNFCVHVANPDSLTLLFFWYLQNDSSGVRTLLKTTASGCYDLNIDSLRIAQGFYHLLVQLNVLGSTVDTYDWGIKVKVELSSFTCSVQPYKGVLLEWETAAETNNLGFNVLKSFSENGNYKKINDKLITNNSAGKYKYLDKHTRAGAKYYYKIEDVSSSGYKTMHGPVVAEVEIPKKFDLSQNYPNPFNPTTTIRYQLPQVVKVRLQIYNIMGQLVRTLVDGEKEPGYHAVIWDGRNDVGMGVGSGVYYYRLIAGEHVMVKKMALLH
ncbi:MAG: T9SS type A sorting domain-containing protein, partial [Actinobacteria bacterium]|nr:T9SS type A sorting domain-containing protein [Actinomycetota bacterium]